MIVENQYQELVVLSKEPITSSILQKKVAKFLPISIILSILAIQILASMVDQETYNFDFYQWRYSLGWWVSVVIFAGITCLLSAYATLSYLGEEYTKVVNSVVTNNKKASIEEIKFQRKAELLLLAKEANYSDKYIFYLEFLIPVLFALVFSLMILLFLGLVALLVLAIMIAGIIFGAYVAVVGFGAYLLALIILEQTDYQNEYYLSYPLAYSVAAFIFIIITSLIIIIYYTRKNILRNKELKLVNRELKIIKKNNSNKLMKYYPNVINKYKIYSRNSDLYFYDKVDFLRYKIKIDDGSVRQLVYLDGYLLILQHRLHLIEFGSSMKYLGVISRIGGGDDDRGDDTFELTYDLSKGLSILSIRKFDDKLIIIDEDYGIPYIFNDFSAYNLEYYETEEKSWIRTVLSNNNYLIKINCDEYYKQEEAEIKIFEFNKNIELINSDNFNCNKFDRITINEKYLFIESKGLITRFSLPDFTPNREYSIPSKGLYEIINSEKYIAILRMPTEKITDIPKKYLKIDIINIKTGSIVSDFFVKEEISAFTNWRIEEGHIKLLFTKYEYDIKFE